jgi:hypothetical protein
MPAPSTMVMENPGPPSRGLGAEGNRTVDNVVITEFVGLAQV